MNKVISLPQEVCGVERYVVTQKPYNIFDKTICFVRLAEKCFYNIKSIIDQEKTMNDYTTQNNCYGGVFVSANNITINMNQSANNDKNSGERNNTSHEMEGCETKEAQADTHEELKEDNHRMTAMEMLDVMVKAAKELYDTPREILKPVYVAINDAYIPPMSHNMFNERYGMNISKASYSDWISPTGRNQYSEKELAFCRKKFLRCKE